MARVLRWNGPVMMDHGRFSNNTPVKIVEWDRRDRYIVRICEADKHHSTNVCNITQLYAFTDRDIINLGFDPNEGDFDDMFEAATDARREEVDLGPAEAPPMHELEVIVQRHPLRPSRVYKEESEDF